MPRLRPRLALVVTAVAPIGVSCSSSATDPARNTGTPALSASEVGFVASLLTRLPLPAVVAHSNSSFTYTGQCSSGLITGVVSIGNSTVDSDGSKTLGTTVTLIPQACVIGTGSRQIAVTGDPSETIQSSLTIAGATLLTSTNKVTGGFKWEGGSCQLNYTATTSLTGSIWMIAVSGTVCGQSVNMTTTF
ncbi:hypothetical protein tb265_24030 [Gemmatimonadetes bacterium T265]|nr:hypothetical protein tb265_24030 [Gemmatimonadetes bacterium T265]